MLLCPSVNLDVVWSDLRTVDERITTDGVVIGVVNTPVVGEHASDKFEGEYRPRV